MRPHDVIPQVVVVGRPNVGKSSLFNWLIEKRIAIEDPTAGVTRDRLVQRVALEGRVFDLVDTGGMGFDDPDGLTAKIDSQIASGLAAAALILFVVEVRSGLLPADIEVAKRVRETGAPVLLVANKADDPKYDLLAHDFDALGFGPPLVVSVRQNRNRDELVEGIVEHLPEAWPEEEEQGGVVDESVSTSQVSQSSKEPPPAIEQAILASRSGKLPGTEQPVGLMFAAGYSTFVVTAPDSTGAGGGAVYAFGLNSYGQLGVGHTKDLSVPTSLPFLSLPGAPGGGVVSIVGGSQHTMALTADGGVFSWGRGDSGQLGIGGGAGNSGSSIPVASSAFRPRQVPLPEPAVFISANACNSAALTSSGTLFTWGFGESGAVCNGGEVDEILPFRVNEPTAATPSLPLLPAARCGKDMQGWMVKSVGVGGQHLVLLAHGKKVDTETEAYTVVTDPAAAEVGDEGLEGVEETT